jgi:hypothetical protein
MTVENHHFLPMGPRPFFQPFAEIDFLGDKQLLAKTAHLPKNLGLAKNK